MVMILTIYFIFSGTYENLNPSVSHTDVEDGGFFEVLLYECKNLCRPSFRPKIHRSSFRPTTKPETDLPSLLTTESWL